jgi:hypothetical protein
MTRPLTITLLAASVAITAATQAQQTTDDQLAAQFVPPAFTAYAASHTYLNDNRTWSMLPVDLDHTGHADYLAVAYGNGHIGYLRVIRKGTTPSLAGESSFSMACDSQPAVASVDLDGDGKPELSFDCRVGNRGTTFSTLFKKSAGTLVPLNAPSTRRANAFEPIREANFIDIDGDGTVEVLEAAAPLEVDASGVLTGGYDVWHLTNGTLAKSAGSLA